MSTSLLHPGFPVCQKYFFYFSWRYAWYHHRRVIYFWLAKLFMKITGVLR
jgi:hypothetical protein